MSYKNHTKLPLVDNLLQQFNHQISNDNPLYSNFGVSNSDHIYLDKTPADSQMYLPPEALFLAKNFRVNFFFSRSDSWTYLPASGFGSLFQHPLASIVIYSLFNFSLPLHNYFFFFCITKYMSLVLKNKIHTGKVYAGTM